MLTDGEVVDEIAVEVADAQRKGRVDGVDATRVEQAI